MRSRASVQLAVIISIIILLCGCILIATLSRELKHYSLKEAREKARIILDRNLATHTYYSHQLKPTLFKTLEPIIDTSYFDARWMSSTYAVREIDKYYRDLSSSEYYYKEAAINARSPENEADPFEHAFLEKLNQSDAVTDRYEVKTFDGRPFFVALRRGETLEEGCLRCHSTPDNAPGGLVEVYGPTRSFHRQVGETISAISIRVPMATAFAESNRLIWKLSAIIAVTLLLVFAGIIYMSNRFIFQPLRSIREQANDVSRKPEYLGKQIPLPSHRELADVTSALNAMSQRLKEEHDKLEFRVQQRTAELVEAKILLEQEIVEHKTTIANLEKALAEVKTLSGLLPICAWCKKIRDDAGYWNRIEAYLSQRSEVQFSHGICPECLDNYHTDDR